MLFFLAYLEKLSLVYFQPYLFPNKFMQDYVFS
jgi:hypothetical protein